jgi:hypothetical protein
MPHKGTIMKKRNIAIIAVLACASATAFGQSMQPYSDQFTQEQAQEQARYQAQEQADIQRSEAPLNSELAHINREHQENQPYGLPTNKELGSPSQP